MKLLTYGFILCFLFFCSKAGLIITGDNDRGFSILKNDRLLTNFTEIYPDKVGNLNFTKISLHLMDKGFGGAITSTGDLYFWGTTDPTNIVPMIQKFKTNETVVDVSTSSTHLLFLTSKKKVFCFGDNSLNACGNSLTCTSASPCVYGDGSLNITAVEAKDQISFVLTDKGEVYTSGSNAEGYLGTGNLGTVTTPQKVIGSVAGKNITKLKSSLTHTFAQDDQGVIYSWGQNINGRNILLTIF
jgi:alpha-tubulin suppressor-like RCC1 family protein